MPKTDSIYDQEPDTKPLHIPSDDELRDITGIDTGEESRIDGSALKDAETRSGLYNPSGDTKSKSESAKGLNQAEQSGAKNASSDSIGGLQNFRSGIVSGFKNNRAVVIGLASGTFGVIFILILLLIIASSLKIPNLAQNIATLEFTRVTRQFAQNAERTSAEALALEATDSGAKNSAYAALKDRYAKSTGKVSQTWSKLDKYRPAKVIQTLSKDNGLHLQMEGNRFVGGTLNGQTFTITQQGKTKFIPVINKLIDFKGNVAFARDFTPALDGALRANEIGPIIRGAADGAIRKELGIGLIAWNLGKFQGKNDLSARIEEESQKIKTVSGSNTLPDSAKTEMIKNEAEQQAKLAAEAADNPTTLDEAIKNNGVLKKAAISLNEALADTFFKETLGAINPLYGIALPICIIYDGSMDNSGSTIDNNTRESQAAYFLIASAADQQKNGTPPTDETTSLTTAVGALNNDLGDISTSNAYIQSTGGTVNTSSSISAEAGAGGQFTLLDATPGISPAVAKTINAVADDVCPVLTSTGGALVIGAANIAAAVASFGASAGAEEAAGQAATLVIKKEASNLAERLIEKVLQKEANSLATSSLSRVSRYLFDTTKSATINAAGVASATIIAKLIVMNRSAQINSGFSQGNDLANLAHNGANIHSGEVSRSQLFGAPEMQTAVQQSDSADAQIIAASAASGSFTERYLSTSNPTSLVAKMAIAVDGGVRKGVVASFVRFCTSIFKPSTYAMLFKPFMGKTLAIASDTHYGNVQFGWTEAEQNLINSSQTYLPLENQQILDTSGQEAEIAQKYAVCFGYTSDSSGNLTLAIGGGQEGSIGTLLAKGLIKRDETGAVINTGSLDDCSPANLGPKNPKYGVMVMRWRLAHSYDTTLDQLTSSQDVSN